MAYYDTICITRDYNRDGTYYSDVPGVPEYVPYYKLRQALCTAIGVMLPELHELDFHEYRCGTGHKAWASVRVA